MSSNHSHSHIRARSRRLLSEEDDSDASDVGSRSGSSSEEFDGMRNRSHGTRASSRLIAPNPSSVKNTINKATHQPLAKISSLAVPVKRRKVLLESSGDDDNEEYKPTFNHPNVKQSAPLNVTKERKSASTIVTSLTYPTVNQTIDDIDIDMISSLDTSLDTSLDASLGLARLPLTKLSSSSNAWISCSSNQHSLLPSTSEDMVVSLDPDGGELPFERNGMAKKSAQRTSKRTFDSGVTMETMPSERSTWITLDSDSESDKFSLGASNSGPKNMKKRKEERNSKTNTGQNTDQPQRIIDYDFTSSPITPQRVTTNPTIPFDVFPPTPVSWSNDTYEDSTTDASSSLWMDKYFEFPLTASAIGPGRIDTVSRWMDNTSADQVLPQPKTSRGGKGGRGGRGGGASTHGKRSSSTLSTSSSPIMV